MEQSDHLTAPAVPTQPSRPARARLLPALLLLLVAIALALRVAHDRAAHSFDPLRGNLEETPFALEDTLRTVPAADQMPLLLTYAHDRSPALRYAALDQLSNRQDPRIADLLEQAFLDSDSKVREVGMLQLVNIDPQRGLHLLLCGLRDDDTWIREAAIMQIKSLLYQKRAGVDRRIVPNLIAALDDPDGDVRQTAMTVLRRLTGHDWFVPLHSAPAAKPAAIDHWKRWWSGARAQWPAADPRLASAAPLTPTRADPCPNFDLYSLDGHPISAQGQRNRITLLNFWGRECGPCIAETPVLVEMDRRYRSRGLDIIGLQVGQAARTEAQEVDEIRNWCRQHGVTYTQAIVSEAMRIEFGNIRDVPVNLLLDRQGRIRYQWEGGPREPEVFGAAIERLLRE